MKEKFNNQEYEVKTKELPSGRKEFELYVGQELVITATQLERNGVKFNDIPNWTIALKTFARGYIKTKSIDESVEYVQHRYPAN